MKAKHEVHHLRTSDHIPVSHFHDPENTSLVHRCTTINGRVLRHAPRKRSSTYFSSLRRPKSLNNLDFQIVTRVLLNASSYTDSVINSPYYSGIILGSLIWVAFSWITRLLHRRLSSFFDTRKKTQTVTFRSGKSCVYSSQLRDCIWALCIQLCAINIVGSWNVSKAGQR